jgi:hypothetical protein
MVSKDGLLKILSRDLRVLRKQRWVSGLKYIERFAIIDSLDYELSGEYNESKKNNMLDLERFRNERNNRIGQ